MGIAVRADKQPPGSERRGKTLGGAATEKTCQPCIAAARHPCYAPVMSPLPTLQLIAVLNGPNMNMLGLRQPLLYGGATLDDVEALCAETAERLDLAIDFRQTNGEGELISWVQECRGRAAGIIINPAGFSHTSIALMDALLAIELPVIEVHVTNIHRREEFRQHSFVSKAATGVICGLGINGYALALSAMAELLEVPGE
jgi:3-dehydroquinate dehydratase II